MKLPGYVTYCLDRLEDAGFAAYCVGGCVRDALLGLTPHDYDLCTQASPEEIQSVFAGHRLVLAGLKHGTVTVILEGTPVEITTFRTEGGYQDSRHPDWVRFVSRVEEDLARRDFTVNAMAWSPSRGLADPFGGREDLAHKVLRAVGDPRQRFSEDALRILRGVRFAVRYRLTPEENTLRAMFDLAPLLDKLARERVFDELCKLLPLVEAEDLLRFCPILTQVIPELRPTVGFLQYSPHHAYDVYTHTAHVVAAVPREVPLRLAALLHDIGKPATFYRDENGRGHFPDHAQVGGEMADDILLRLKSPTALRQRATDLIRRHMTPLEPDKTVLRRRLGKYGPDGVRDLLALQRADFGSKGTGAATDFFPRIESLLNAIEQEDACLSLKDLVINGRDLLALGIPPGKAVGQCLSYLLEQVQSDALPNEKAPLLAAAQEFLSRQKIIPDQQEVLP